jgi:hypothetical protein
MDTDWSKVKRRDWVELGTDFSLKVQRDLEPDTGSLAIRKKEDERIFEWKRCPRCGSRWWGLVKGSGGRPTPYCEECRSNRNPYFKVYMRKWRAEKKQLRKVEERRARLPMVKDIHCPNYDKCLNDHAKADTIFNCAACPKFPIKR